MKTYQFAATAEECALYRDIRQLLDSDPSNPRLQQTLSLTLHAGDRFIGDYEVDATQFGKEIVRAGGDFLQKLLTVQEPEEKSDNGNEDVQVHDGDLNADTQSISKATEDYDTSGNSPTWDVIRSQMIPSCVKDIMFTVSKEEVNPTSEEQLRDLFPGVIIPSDHCTVEDQRLRRTEKPEDIEMVIELDEAAVARDPQLASPICERFPCTSIGPKLASNISKKRIIPTAESSSVTHPTLDPGKHLADLAHYATEPPTEDEFGYYCPLNEGWDLLPYVRKLEIAHARAMHGTYGQAIEGIECSHCTAQGYECKVYCPQLGDLAPMSFLGRSCQNCRIQGTACEFSVAAEDRQVQTPITTSVSERQSVAREQSVIRTREASRAPSTAVMHEPGSASHVGRSELGQPTGDIDASNPQVETPPETEDRSERQPLESQLTNRLQAGTILARAQAIGLELSETIREEVCSMYTQGCRNREIDPFHGSEDTLEDFYRSLVTLYIVADKKTESQLRYAVLLRFQVTNYQCDKGFPDIETAVLAFQYLPTRSPLCKWIANLFSFLWGTRKNGDYETFIEDRPSLDPLALSKLLYAIALIRDPHTEGGDLAVMTEWCGPHNHPKLKGPGWNLCQKMWDPLQERYDKYQAKYNARRLEEAIADIKELKPTLLNERSEDSNIGSSSNKGKRKAVSSAGHSSKKIKGRE